MLGLRRGELAGLANEDIEDGILHIQRSVNSLGIVTGGKTENAQRYIRLSQTAIDILADQRRSLADKSLISKWIFPNQDGSVMDTNSLYKHWRAYSEQHGIKSNLHELRHTFISTVKADMPEQLLKSMVGHSANMDTFRVYGHEVDGDRQRAANIVDEVFRKLI